MIPSTYQQAIFSAIENSSDSLAIIAVAGSGKTTTIVEAAKKLPSWKLSVFLAFNKAIAEELKQKLPYFVQAHTFHSFAFSAIKQSWKTPPKVDFNKTKRLLKTLVSDDELWENLRNVSDLVSYAKGAGLGLIPNAPSWADLIEYYDLVCDDEPLTIALAQGVLAKSNADVESVDFDDMLYFALRDDVKFTPCDFVFVDEAQDLNSVQHALLKKMLKKDGRLIAVGDPNQAIYERLHHKISVRGQCLRRNSSR